MRQLPTLILHLGRFFSFLRRVGDERRCENLNVWPALVQKGPRGEERSSDIVDILIFCFYFTCRKQGCRTQGFFSFSFRFRVLIAVPPPPPPRLARPSLHRFRFLERAVYEANGVEPIAWKLDPSLKEVALSTGWLPFAAAAPRPEADAVASSVDREGRAAEVDPASSSRFP